jgi:Fic family protein
MDLIKEIHKVLTGGTYDERRYVQQDERPGEFKKHDYVTGQAEVGSLPEDVEGDISELLGELNERVDNPEAVLKAAAYFHARFEYIHPFADGNGRVGRVLLNYYLMLHNHPPLIVYDEDKAAYYDALAAYDNTEDLAAMFSFLRSQVVRTWEKTLARQSAGQKHANSTHG